MPAVISGMLEKQGKLKNNKGVISAVGGGSIPPVNHYIAGYKWAATMEDPGIKVLVGYSNDFTDPAKCKGVAQGQIQANSDVVFQVAGGCGLGALQAAWQAGGKSIRVGAGPKDAHPPGLLSAFKKSDRPPPTTITKSLRATFRTVAPVTRSTTSRSRPTSRPR